MSEKTVKESTKDSTKNNLESAPAQPAKELSGVTSVTGRGVFVVQTVNGGVAVRSAMMVPEQRYLDMPAIFPDVHYAMAQIDELKVLVARHFADAAQVGTQMIAAQAQAQAQAQASQPEAAAVNAFDSSPSTGALN